MTGSLTQPTDRAVEPFAELLPAVLRVAGNRTAREAAFEQFCAGGLPHRKAEAWKYTDVSKAVAGPFIWNETLAAPVRGAGSLFVEPLAEAGFPTPDPQHPFALLNRVFANGGWRVTVPAGFSTDVPIELCFDSAPESLVCPVVVIQAGVGSRADIILRFDSGEGALTSVVVNVDVAEGASLSVTKIRTGTGAHFSHVKTRQSADSRLALFDATVGGTLTRNDLYVALNGEGSEAELNGLYALGGREHADNHTAIEHAVPHTVSRQFYKGIIGGHACGVFNGRIVVDPGASGTDALQMNRNLLCSRTAKIDTKPQLEIGNDDVRCSHGATIGRLDETQVFYLESRGMDRPEAEALLARGFAGEVIDLIKSPIARERLYPLVEQFFEQEPE